PGPGDGLPVLREDHVHRAAGGGDVHGVAHGVLDVVAEAVCVAGLGDEDGGLDLVGADVHPARPQVEVLDGQAADAPLSRQFDYSVPGKEGGGGVGGGDAVAGVAADGAGVADLGPAHHVHRLAQIVDIFLNNGVPGNVAEAGE